MDTGLKLAVYLDEAGTEPGAACKALNDHDIKYTVIRYGWGDKNICEVQDRGCEQLRKLLDVHNLSVVAIASDLGDTFTSQLSQTPLPTIKRAFSLVTYFKAAYIRIYVGEGAGSYDDIDLWMTSLTEHCIAANCTPLLEITPYSLPLQPAELATLLHKHRRWKLLYDPVQFILKRNLNPHLKYWTLLKNSVGAVDVRDFKVGRGFKPPGFGDSRILDTVQDAIASKYSGWFFLEPSLGRRYGNAITKSDTLKLALETLQPFAE
jgi:hypothetical protein